MSSSPALRIGSRLPAKKSDTSANIPFHQRSMPVTLDMSEKSTHTSLVPSADVIIQWNTVNSLQTTQRFLYEGYAGAYASFIRTGSPNTHKLTNDSVVAWPTVGTGREWVMASTGFTDESLAALGNRCDFWRKVGKYVPL